MKHPAIDLLQLAAEAFSFLEAPPLFFGGATVPIYLDNPDCLRRARVTEDVDLVVEVSAPDRTGFAATLERHGFVQDPRHKRRWTRDGRAYDIVDAEYLPAEDWARPGRGRVVESEIGGGSIVRVLSYWSLLACKIAAFDDPRRRDSREPQESADFQDIVLLLMGCDSFDRWLERPELALGFVRSWTTTFDPWGFRLMAYPHMPRVNADAHLDRLAERLRALERHTA